MSVDLKIERFGLELANRLFVDYNVEGFTPHPLTEYEDVESELNKSILNAVKVHMSFFITHYDEIYRQHYENFKNNQMDFLQMIIKSFPHRGCKNVMSKFISSCAFVIELCLASICTHDSNFLNKIHMIWAMFVDIELKDEFYLFGGWKELRKCAWLYHPVYRFLKEFNMVNENYLCHRVDITLQSVANLTDFCKVKSEESPEPVALQWVDFTVKHPVDPEAPRADIPELDWTLWMLQQITNPMRVLESVYEQVIVAGEEIGMNEKDSMDAIANNDFRKHPEFYGIYMRLYYNTLCKACEEGDFSSSVCSFLLTNKTTGEQDI